jgi:hypothetical protein
LFIYIFICILVNSFFCRVSVNFYFALDLIFLPNEINFISNRFFLLFLSIQQQKNYAKFYFLFFHTLLYKVYIRNFAIIHAHTGFEM